MPELPDVPDTWRFHHLGMPVRDLDQSVAAYQSLGIATFDPEFRIDSSQAESYLVYGKTPDPIVITRGQFVHLGPVSLELLQPVQPHTVHKELLDSTGEGIGHLAYSVDDLEAEVAKLVERGFPEVLSIIPKNWDRRSAVYLDTRGVFANLIIELMAQR